MRTVDVVFTERSIGVRARFVDHASETMPAISVSALRTRRHSRIAAIARASDVRERGRAFHHERTSPEETFTSIRQVTRDLDVGPFTLHWDGYVLLFVSNALGSKVLTYFDTDAEADGSGKLTITDRDDAGNLIASGGTVQSTDFQGNLANIMPPFTYVKSDGISLGQLTNYGYPAAHHYEIYANDPIAVQGGRVFDANMAAWTTPDAYKGEVSDPASMERYMWNGNNAVVYSDPTGYNNEPEPLGGGGVGPGPGGSLPGMGEEFGSGSDGGPSPRVAPAPEPPSASKPSVGPGPYAKDPVPASRTNGQPTASERKAVAENGRLNGCHTCGTKNFGNKSGNPVTDHQQPSGLNPLGLPQYYLPQCLPCSRIQGGTLLKIMNELSFPTGDQRI